MPVCLREGRRGELNHFGGYLGGRLIAMRMTLIENSSSIETYGEGTGVA